MRAHQRPGRAPCSLDGCPKPMYARRLCVMHYARLARYGDVGMVAPQRGDRGKGSITEEGYVVVCLPSHPLAGAQGKVYRNRLVLFEKLGPGEHPCHWCGILLPWQGRPSRRINADHLDAVRTNDVPENLVPACLNCNTHRARRQLLAVLA